MDFVFRFESIPKRSYYKYANIPKSETFAVLSMQMRVILSVVLSYESSWKCRGNFPGEGICEVALKRKMSLSGGQNGRGILGRKIKL